MNYCPYCNSDKGIEFKCYSEYQDECFSMDLTCSDVYEHNGRMFVSECLNCGRLILSDDYGGELEPELYDKTEVLYPKRIWNRQSLPPEVRSTYSNAKRIQSLNTEAFAMSIRKCIEIICKLHGIDNGSLNKKIKDLCDLLNLPELLSKAAHNIRLVGNEAAHDVEGIHPVNIQIIDDYFNVLVEYVYILPSKLSWFQKINNIEHAELPPITKDGRWVFKKGEYQR